jgi:hypothetical protein
MKKEAAEAASRGPLDIPNYEPSAFAVELERRLLNREGER